MKTTTDALVSPKEVSQLAKYCTIADCQIANDMWFGYLKDHPHALQPGRKDRYYEVSLAITALYNAGRVQGIREERARRNRTTPRVYRRIIDFS